MKKSLIIFLACLLFPLASIAEGRVFLASETEPFSDDAQLLTLRVAGTCGGDSMLLSYGDETMLIDAGTENFPPFIEQMLDENGTVYHVDMLFNTHPHRDHINGLFAMLENGFSVGQICTVFPHDYEEEKPSVVQLKMMQAAEEYHIPVTDMKNGDVFSFGPAEITVLRVPDNLMTPMMNTNDKSAMLLIRIGECSMLMTGDCEIRAQVVLARLYDMKVDILKEPHHGLGNMHRSFLENTNPEFVFFTNGSSDTRASFEQLRRFGLNRCLFASWGEITFQTDGKKWIVSQKIHDDVRNHAEKYMETISRRP